MRASKRSHEKDREIWFEALLITSQSSRVSFQQLTWCMDVGTTWNNAVSEGPLKDMFIFSTPKRGTDHYTLGSSFAWKNCKKERFLHKVAFRVVVFLFLSPARCCFSILLPIRILSFSENGLVNKLLWSVWYVPGNVLNRKFDSHPTLMIQLMMDYSGGGWRTGELAAMGNRQVPWVPFSRKNRGAS